MVDSGKTKGSITCGESKRGDKGRGGDLKSKCVCEGKQNQAGLFLPPPPPLHPSPLSVSLSLYLCLHLCLSLSLSVCLSLSPSLSLSRCILSYNVLCMYILNDRHNYHRSIFEKIMYVFITNGTTKKKVFRAYSLSITPPPRPSLFSPFIHFLSFCLSFYISFSLPSTPYTSLSLSLSLSLSPSPSLYLSLSLSLSISLSLSLYLSIYIYISLYIYIYIYLALPYNWHAREYLTTIYVLLSRHTQGHTSGVYSESPTFYCIPHSKE